MAKRKSEETNKPSKECGAVFPFKPGLPSTIPDSITVSTMNVLQPTMTEEEKWKAEEVRLIKVLNSLDISDKVKLSEAIGRLVKVRLSTELKVMEGVGVGILSENLTVENAALLLNKSKDSLSELIKIKRLIDGEQDGDVVLKIVMDKDEEVKEFKRRLGLN